MSQLGTYLVESIDREPEEWAFADNGTRFNFRDGRLVSLGIRWYGPVLRVGRGPGLSLWDKFRVWRAIRRWKVMYLKAKLLSGAKTPADQN